MYFIDKLNVHQNHTGNLDIVGRQLVARKDLTTGKVCFGPNAKFIEGSHSSKLTIRCDGERVEITGNPSRFNRVENLFGFETFDECIQVYNTILAEFDLPPFTKCTKLYYINSTADKITMVSDGAMLDHVDFTKNYLVGEGNEETFIKALAGQCLGKGKEPYLYPNHKTVDWYKGSKLKYKKVYVKAHDLIEHRKKRLKNATSEDIEYYDNVIQYCLKHGVVREEHSFKRDWLSLKNMQFYGMVKESDFNSHLCDIEDAMKKFEVVKTKFESVADKLIRLGVCKSRQSANSTMYVYDMWRHGSLVVGETLSRAQFYEHKKRLKFIGVDISVKHDISYLPLQIVSSHVIEVKPCVKPDWYISPRILRAVQ